MTCEPWIQTVSGVAFDLAEPAPSAVRRWDIAHALARLPRFNGHTRGPLAWNGAQHSLLVLHLLPDGSCPSLRLAALLHDAHEAYIGDISTPVAGLLGDALPTLKDRIQRAVDFAAGLPLAYPCEWRAAIRVADRQALVIERRQLLGACDRAWGVHDADVPDWPALDPLPPDAAAMRFLADWRALDRLRPSVQPMRSMDS